MKRKLCDCDDFNLPDELCRKIKMLYLVGLGLADETDITVKGLEVVKKAERVYLEAYTSILLVDKQKLVCISSSLLVIHLSHNFKRYLWTKGCIA